MEVGNGTRYPDVETECLAILRQMLKVSEIGGIDDPARSRDVVDLLAEEV